MNELTTTKPNKTKKLKPKQKLAIDNWLNPASQTFGNLYQSCIKAGFRPTYALNIAHLRPSWLSETINQIQLDTDHIKQGIQAIATAQNLDSRSPADTNLKAYELLAKMSGQIDNKNGNTTNILVQPILGGSSAIPTIITERTHKDVTTPQDNVDTSTKVTPTIIDH